MFHLANFDEGVFAQRMQARVSDAKGGSYDSHAVTRRSVSAVIDTCDSPLDFDEGIARARIQLSTRGGKTVVYRPQKFRDGTVEFEGNKAFLVRIDPRFRDIL